MGQISMMLGQVLEHIEVEDERITFRAESGRSFAMFHGQDCCESVSVESIVGDMTALLGSPIILAEEAESEEDPADVDLKGVEYQYRESFTWTFYKLGTVKGQVDIRWYGSSNGYYSESVDFVDLAA